MRKVGQLIVLSALLTLLLLRIDPVAAQDRANIEIVPVFNHTNWVTSIAFSSDGARVLSGGWDNALKLWDAATGALIRTFQGHSKQVWSVALSADGARVLRGSGGKQLKRCEAATGVLIRTFQGHSESVRSVAFSPDGARVLSGSGDTGGRDYTLKLWDANTGALILTFQG